LAEAHPQMSSTVKGKYETVKHKLVKEVRFFLATNFILYLLVFAVLYWRKGEDRVILLPAGLLILATIISTIFYLFFQDWGYAILYNSYMGSAYLGYTLIIFLLLLDIVMNKGRVTLFIIRMTGHIVEVFANLLSAFAV
jgi:hypothetical protein